MKDIKKASAALFFTIFLGVGACETDHATSTVSAGRDAVGAVTSQETEIVTEGGLNEADSCECGKFMDEDMDGVCDLAMSGECRKARTGRCPCGNECTGC